MSQPGVILFRVDSGPLIGSGHLRRCLNLARVLRSRGKEVHFVCRNHVGSMHELAIPHFEVHLLPGPVSGTQNSGTTLNYADWLGQTQKTDARQTLAIMEHHQINLAIVDHYAIGREWEEIVAGKASRILAIDDLANREHEVDFLLNENIYQGSDDYSNLISAGTTALFGSEYALLDESYAAAQEIAATKQLSKINNLLVFVGSVDATGECQKFLQSMDANPGIVADTAITVLLGPANPMSAELKARYGHLDLRIIESTTDMPNLLLKQDYVLGALGFSIWERFCLGVNSTIVSVAHNQEAVSERLASMGLVDYLGSHSHIGPQDYAQFVYDLKSRPIENLRSRRERIMLSVDGFGCQRVADLILD